MHRFLSPFVAYLTPQIATVLVGGAALFLVGSSVFAYSLFHPSRGDSSIFALLQEVGSTKAQAVAVAPKGSNATPAILGITIANNGLTYLKNATVTGVSGHTLTASISWGKADFPWTVETSYVTLFLLKSGTSGTLESIHVGDQVSITGMLEVNATEPTIKAKSIRISTGGEVA